MNISLKQFHKELISEYELQLDEIKPIFQDKNLIVLSSSDFYVKYASVLLSSIIKNSLPYKTYDIIFLTTDITIYNKHILSLMIENYNNISIRFLDISSKINRNKLYTRNHFTINTYFRLLIPALFSQYEKVLYLDSDTVCNTDISQLFEYNLKNNYIASALDTHVLAYCNMPNSDQLKYNTEILNLKKPYEYYQMGVCIFNIKEILKDFEPFYFIKAAENQNFKHLDQDILNIICQNKILKLPVKWNVMIANKPPYIDEYYLDENLKKEYCKARMKPLIVHYVGGLCFKYPLFPDLGYYFWQYARISPYYEEILKIKYDNFYNIRGFCIKMIMNISHYKIIVLKYWKYKILTAISKGKKKEEYKQAKANLKEKIRFVKNIEENEW